MPDVPFFRGKNRLDALFGLTIQNCFDWGYQDNLVQACGQWGYAGDVKWTFQLDGLPPVGIVTCTDYMFVLFGSTQSVLQWLGNLLGARARTFPDGPGLVHSYFFSAAEKSYNTFRSYLIANKGSRKVVLVGFSLGSAIATICKYLLLARDGMHTSCLAFGSPRCGDPTWEESYPHDDFVRFSMNNDPVPSLPPETWSEEGKFIGWVFYGPPVSYKHVAPGYTLYLPNEIRDGDQLPDTNEVIRDFNLGLFRNFHNQDIYCRILRNGLPNPLSVPMDGQPQPTLIDSADQVALPPWPFGQSTGGNFDFTLEGPNMIRALLAFRLRNGTGLGWQEDYYFNGSTPQDVLNIFQPESPGVFLNKRTAFLTSDCEIYAMSVNVIGTPRKGRLVKLPTPAVGTVSNDTPDVVDCITYFGYTADDLHRRQFHFRGLAKTWIDASTLTPVGVTGLAAIEYWLQALINVSMQISLPSVDATGTFSGITKAAMADLVKLNVNPAINTTQKLLITITGARKFPLLNGQWILPSTGGVDLAAVPIAGTAAFNPPADTTGNYKIITQNNGTGAQMTRFAFNGVSKKDTGRQLFLRRGRRSPRLRHR